MNTLEKVPTRVFRMVILLVCVGLALSSGYTFVTFSDLREEYMNNLGHDIFRSIMIQFRHNRYRSADNAEDRKQRFTRHHKAEQWKSSFEQIAEDYKDILLFVELVDQSKMTLASTGSVVVNASSGFIENQGTQVYVFEQESPAKHRRPGKTMSGNGKRRFRIGLHTAPADFIMKQAYGHLAMSSVAIITLLVLSYYFLRTLKSYLEIQAREQSEKHLTAMGGMAATLAHEIRNPLGAMKGLTQVIKEELPDDHKSQTKVQTVINEAERLEHLVNELLTFSRPTEAHIATFDLEELILSVKSILQTTFSDKQVEINMVTEKGASMIQSDENGLKQVLLNVLLNAVEATPKGGGVTVSSSVTGNLVVIEVDDQGTGFGNKDPEELFAPFLTTKVNGTGLGLSISRQIIENLNGNITICGNSDGGTKCTVRFPVEF